MALHIVRIARRQRLQILIFIYFYRLQLLVVSLRKATGQVVDPLREQNRLQQLRRTLNHLLEDVLVVAFEHSREPKDLI